MGMCVGVLVPACVCVCVCVCVCAVCFDTHVSELVFFAWVHVWVVVYNTVFGKF